MQTLPLLSSGAGEYYQLWHASLMLIVPLFPLEMAKISPATHI